MSQHRASIGGTIGGMAWRANSAFVGGIVAVSVTAFAYTVTVGLLQQHTFVHVMAGLLQVGTDSLMGAILGPIIGGLSDEQSAVMFGRLTPKTSFLLPSMVLVIIADGIMFARQLDAFPHAEPWLVLLTTTSLIPICLLPDCRLNAWRNPWRQAVFAAATVGSLAWVATTIGDFRMTTPTIVVVFVAVAIPPMQSFSLLTPGEVRMYLEMTPEDLDSGVISAVGKQNAMLGGAQGVLQLVLTADMMYFRYGGF